MLLFLFRIHICKKFINKDANKNNSCRLPVYNSLNVPFKYLIIINFLIQPSKCNIGLSSNKNLNTLDSLQDIRNREVHLINSTYKISDHWCQKINHYVLTQKNM